MGADLQLTQDICGDYGVEFFPLVPVYYNNVSKGHYYIDKYVGAQSLRNPSELGDALARKRKLYVGIDGLNRWDTLMPELVDFLTTHCQPVIAAWTCKYFFGINNITVAMHNTLG